MVAAPRHAGGDTSRAPGSTVHRICGQLCGEPRRATRKPAPLRRLLWIAQKFSKQKGLQIKHLDDFDITMTRPMRRLAWFGAPVEFPSRAVAGFPDD
jgi:hypothetical protein